MSRLRSREATAIGWSRLTLMIVVGLLSTVHTGAVSAPGAENNPSAIIDVQVSAGQLTVDVRDAPLGQVLGTIGMIAGIEVTLRGDVSASVTQSFTRLPLEEGVRRLARGYAVAVTYRGSRDESGHEVVTGVWVMEGSSGSSSRTDEPADVGVAELTSESPLAGRIWEIQRLQDGADRGSADSVARLAELGASDADAGLREQAIAALARLKTPAVEPAITAALADDDASVRIRAIRGLRGFGSDRAAQSIAEISLADPDPHVRLAAVTALMSLPGGSMRRGLAKASGDPDEAVREIAIRGLTWWNTRLSIGP